MFRNPFRVACLIAIARAAPAVDPDATTPAHSAESIKMNGSDSSLLPPNTPPPAGPSDAGIDETNINWAYTTILILLSVACAVLLYADAGCNLRSVTTMRLSKLDFLYLPAYALCSSADWLQGPYVYALYSSYGFDRFTL